MVAPGLSLTITLPRSAVEDLPGISAALMDRMHELLERNTEESLTPLETEQLETLVQMAQFSQIVSMAVQAQAIK